MLKDKGYDLPSKIFDEQLDVDATMKRVKEKIKRSEDYERNEKELPYFKDYLSRLEHIKAAPKYIGDGIRRYKQPKRNAYKITNNQYGGLLIDVPSLMNRMKWNAYRGRGGGGVNWFNKQMQTDHWARLPAAVRENEDQRPDPWDGGNRT